MRSLHAQVNACCATHFPMYLCSLTHCSVLTYIHVYLQVKEAKKYYPLFGMFANVALVFSGQFVRYVSQMKVPIV